MAITPWGGTRDLIVKAIEAVGHPLSKISIAEFGNQKMKSNTTGMRRIQSAKGVFEWFGARHVSIDINGRDGAVTHDLGKEISKDHPVIFAKGQFDIVTNCGTSEHVKTGQVNVFANAHALCKRNGVMAHAVPYQDSPPCFGHGFWKYSVEWFAKLAKDNNYDVLWLDKADMNIGLPSRNPVGTFYCFALLRKRFRGPFNVKEFVDPKQQ